jgi:hypothetical protein
VPSAFDSAATTADFSTFHNLDANGNWTLFFADTVTGGGNPTLTSWSLDITPVPEPVSVALAVFAAGGSGLGARRAPEPQLFRAPTTDFTDNTEGMGRGGDLLRSGSVTR